MTDVIEWRVVPGFPQYEVSNGGEYRRIGGRVLRVRIHRGYVEGWLYRNGLRHTRRLHTLVALAFLDPPDFPFPEVNHEDGVKTHNWPSNLSWVTRKEQMRHAVRTGLVTIPNQRGSAHSQARLTDRTVSEIRAAPRSVSNKILGTKYGIDPSQVSRIRNRKVWTHL